MTEDPLYLSPPRYERPLNAARSHYAESRRRNLGTLLAAAAACAIGVAIGFAAPRLMRETTPRAAPVVAVAPPVASPPQALRILAAYQLPQRARFVEAQAEVERLYGAEGLVGLKRASEQCYARLARDVSYERLDACIAFDAFATVKAQAGALEPGALTAYFEDGPARRQRVVEAFVGRPDEIYPRLLAINALVVELAGPAGSVTPAPPIRVAAAPAPRPIAAVALNPVPIIPAPRPAPAPAPAPVVRAPPQIASATPPPMPRRAAPKERPSFDCRDAASVAEEMVCAEPELAREDRRLQAAYRYALQITPQPRRIEREQSRWLAERDQLGPDYDAVLDHYERRIDELWTGDE